MSPAEGPDLCQALARLRALLTDSDGDAMEALQEVAPVLAGTEHEALLETLQDSLGAVRP